MDDHGVKQRALTATTTQDTRQEPTNVFKESQSMAEYRVKCHQTKREYFRTSEDQTPENNNKKPQSERTGKTPISGGKEDERDSLLKFADGRGVGGFNERAVLRCAGQLGVGGVVIVGAVRGRCILLHKSKSIEEVLRDVCCGSHVSTPVSSLKCCFMMVVGDDIPLLSILKSAGAGAALTSAAAPRPAARREKNDGISNADAIESSRREYR